jgi:hypothetical protein
MKCLELLRRRSASKILNPPGENRGGTECKELSPSGNQLRGIAGKSPQKVDVFTGKSSN